MEIDDKYIRLIGKPVYSKELDKHGFISKMEITSGFGGVYPVYRAYFDVFDGNNIITLDDFMNGELKFAIPSGLPEYEELYKRIKEDAQLTFGEKYSDDMILLFNHEEWEEIQKQAKIRNKRRLWQDLASLDKISVDVFYNNFYTQELYQKYKSGVLAETQMLYGVVNYLCCENKRLADKNFEYFSKYELKYILDK